MATCRKCGGPLRFIQKPGRGGVMKWWPVEPDGTNHFDRCREIQIKAMTEAQREAMRQRDQEIHPPQTTGKRGRHVWCGPIPPWEDALGSFRPFTHAEIQEGVVCRRI